MHAPAFSTGPPPNQAAALLAVRSGLYDPNRLLSSWGNTSDPCDGTWYGIECDQDTKSVTGLVLSVNTDLSGTLPDALRYLTTLQV